MWFKIKKSVCDIINRIIYLIISLLKTAFIIKKYYEVSHPFISRWYFKVALKKMRFKNYLIRLLLKESFIIHAKLFNKSCVDNAATSNIFLKYY